MAERTISIEILNSINNYIKEVSKYYNIDTVILFGSYAKGNEHEDSDIDIAIISSDITDRFDDMAKMMKLTWTTDVRIEPHPIKKEDYEEVSDPFIEEIINTGIKVA